VGKPFDYEGLSPGSENILSFSLDYHVDNIEVACENWTEDRDSAGCDDLLARSRNLVKLLQISNNRYNDLHRVHRQLMAKLTTEISNGLDRSERKLRFSENHNATKAEAMKACLDVYATFRRLLDEED
jgi:hypothetical protein